MLRVSWRTASQSFPKSGNRELPISLIFSNVSVIQDDLSAEMQQSEIESIQSDYIDNSQNPNPLVLKFGDAIGQEIVADEFTQGIYPVITSGTVKYTATTVQNAALVVPIIFSNTAKPFFVWGPTGLSLTPVVVNNDAGGNIAAPAANGNLVTRIWKMFLVFGGITNITMQNGNTALSGPMPFAANGTFVLDLDKKPWFTTSAGSAFNINSSAAEQVSGTVYYTQSAT